MATKTTIKKWGNSFGVIIPIKEIIEKKLSENDIVEIEIFKEANFSDVFGTIKTKTSGQEFENEAKKGWK